MKRTIIFVALLTAHLTMGAQIKFEVKFSKSFAVLEFIQKLSAQSGPNPFKKLFTGSVYDIEKYRALLAAFDEIPIDYEHEFRGYPPFTKRGAETESLLKQHLLNSLSLDDFKIRSLALIPISDLIELVSIIREFTPLYDKLIYDPNKAIFKKQVRDIEELLTKKNIAGYFDQARQFYNATWDNSIPFIFTFYPLPDSKGYTATTFSNIAVSAIPTSLTDYNGMLSVLLHELAHVLYDVQSLPFKKEIDNWFTSNPSMYSRYAYNLLNESWATAVGNGYFYEKLSGKLNAGSWYNSKYINLMGKQMYPAIKAYIDGKKPVDKSLVDQYIKTYEDSFSNSITELNFLLNGRYGIAENPSDFDTLDRIFPPRFVAEYYHDFSPESFTKLNRITITKIIIVSGDNKNKLNLITQYIPELKEWKAEAGQDFVKAFILKDKTALIILNNVETSTRKKLEALNGRISYD